ncbi:MAG TPA: hypothetical protein VK968_11275, partial [Roseimicrobium sp.]|nr:hypothetical protein [Roseimicrobium sp.]
NAAYFQHQVGLVKKNLETVAGLLFQVDWIGFGLLSLLACVVILPPWRERLGTERWRWGAFALAITAGIYLPVYVRVADDRYFYIAFPLFWSTAAGVVLWMTSKSAAKNPWPRRIGLGIVTVSFGFFPAFRAVSAAGGLNNPPVVAAHMLSERLIKAGLAGPVAGSASIFGERAGLYTAFLLDQPWVGDKPDATLQEWRDSGARLVILKRDDPQAAVLSTAPGFRDLDGALSSDPSWNSGFPLKVFEILR